MIGDVGGQSELAGLTCGPELVRELTLKIMELNGTNEVGHCRNTSVHTF